MPVGMVMSNQIGTPMLVNVAGGYMSQGSNIPTIGQMVPIQQQPLQQQRQMPSAVSNNMPGDTMRIVHKRHLQELLRNIDPLGQLDEEVEEVLLQIGDDFIEDVVSSAAQIAAHRKSKILESKDVMLYLDRHWDLWVPGFSGPREDTKPKKAIATETHKLRLEMIRKALKQ